MKKTVMMMIRKIKVKIVPPLFPIKYITAMGNANVQKCPVESLPPETRRYIKREPMNKINNFDVQT
jgi:hypothetical protein